ncbi:hypothetical protein WICPIJ_009368 [Wickerhamomyces pijperi]|uniref:Arf-GAP domain-containing protein n=1 Tax=Wickerhamomyces pijperi TaxID=599730 RepID=A0A9P8PNZ5_WICPI|nr:hypothetical protein WICPIJ_009368 [Wickerhamomyces pijperi]
MSTSKADVAKNHQILKALVKQQGNNHCADCKTATHPRWASWNLGIFICIRCSGIHRSMGTHISRVKSVDLDSWTNEQTESMLKWGNIKANTFWESQLPGEPGSYSPDDSKIENFIKTKYDLKKWAASKTVPNPSTISASASVTAPTTASAPAPAPAPQHHHQQARQTQHHQAPQQVNKRPNNPALLDLEFGSPVSASTNSLPSMNQKPAGSAHFGVNSTRQPQQPAYQQRQSAPQQQPQQQNDRPDLKKSILSLYSTPRVSNSTPNFPLRNNTMPLQQPQYSNNNSTTNSLNGLNFSSSSSASSINTNGSNQWGNPSPSPQVQQQNQWSNTASRAQPQQNTFRTGNSALDDDLFKNHWN